MIKDETDKGLFDWWTLAHIAAGAGIAFFVTIFAFAIRKITDISYQFCEVTGTSWRHTLAWIFITLVIVKFVAAAWEKREERYIKELRKHKIVDIIVTLIGGVAAVLIMKLWIC